MEITGKVIHVLERREGTSARTGNAWAMQSYVLETQDGQYPRHMVFEVFGEDRLREFNIQAGEDLRVSFDIDAREYQGRWFNSIRAWKVDRNVEAVGGYGTAASAVGAAPTAAPIGQPAASAAPVGGGFAPEPANSNDDLPF